MTKPEDTTRTAQLASGVSALVQIVTAPPHLPNLGTVTTRAVECLRIGTHHLQIPDKLFQLIEDLDRSTSSVQSSSSPTLLFGLSGDFPAWTMLAGSTFPADSSSKKALGAAITIAWLRGVQIQKSLISELRSLIKKRADEAIDVTKYEAESKKLADRQTKKLIAVLQIYGSGLNSQEVNQQVKLQSALKARFSSLRIVERQAAGRSNELPQSQLEEATRGLWNKAKSGCGNSLDATALIHALAQRHGGQTVHSGCYMTNHSGPQAGNHPSPNQAVLPFRSGTGGHTCSAFCAGF